MVLLGFAVETRDTAQRLVVTMLMFLLLYTMFKKHVACTL